MLVLVEVQESCCRFMFHCLLRFSLCWPLFFVVSRIRDVSLDGPSVVDRIRDLAKAIVSLLVR